MAARVQRNASCAAATKIRSVSNFWAAVVSERRLERHPGKSDTTRRRTGALRYFFPILPWTATNAAKMKMSKLSNQTNSQDPQAVNSRVFVGNLNTFQCSKTDVERMFQRYGRLAESLRPEITIITGRSVVPGRCTRTFEGNVRFRKVQFLCGPREKKQ
uniref:RRM domain-containing protein n=1 Tax=Anopheles merus TaxID=30066 RepID=A0A182VCT7_ANOME